MAARCDERFAALNAAGVWILLGEIEVHGTRVSSQAIRSLQTLRAPDEYGKPREVLIGELTGDGVDDIVLLVHDRLIIYPGQ